jgi:hypothetical protein
MKNLLLLSFAALCTLFVTDVAAQSDSICNFSQELSSMGLGRQLLQFCGLRKLFPGWYTHPNLGFYGTDYSQIKKFPNGAKPLLKIGKIVPLSAISVLKDDLKVETGTYLEKVFPEIAIGLSGEEAVRIKMLEAINQTIIALQKNQRHCSKLPTERFTFLICGEILSVQTIELTLEVLQSKPLLGNSFQRSDRFIQKLNYPNPTSIR